MADFSKFKIGNTSYNVKDVNAARDIDIVGMPGQDQGRIQAIDASGNLIGSGAVIDINDNRSINHTYIDSQTLADGDVLTWDASGQSWQNKPASGGGGGDTGFYPVLNILNSSWNTPSGYFSALLNAYKIPFTDNIGFNIFDGSSAYLGVRPDAIIFNRQWQNVKTYLETLPTLGDTVTIDMFKWHGVQNMWFWIRVNATCSTDGFGLTSVGAHGFNSNLDPAALPYQ